MERAFHYNDVISLRNTEEATFALYQAALKPYAEKFAKYGASLSASIEREGENISSNACTKINSTYKAYIVCKWVDRNEKVIESLDHDMTMDFAWLLSACENDQVIVYADIDSDMIDILQACEEYFSHPY